MKSILNYFILSLIVLLLSATLFELLLGAVFMYKDRSLEPEQVKDFPYLYYLFDNNQGDFNIHGFKTTYSIDKPDSVYRVILVGGSVARGNEPETTIAAYLEKMLKLKTGNKNIEVINAGVSGFVVEQEFIMLQMILQYYTPDMIIGFDGYNDLLSFKLNRFTDTPYKIAPHHWNEFKTIKANKFKNKWYSRFSAPFYNINRAKDFIIRNQKERNYDWTSVSNEIALKYSNAYWDVIIDHRDFCGSKGIDYMSFLQPVRFYNKQYEPDDTEQKALSKIYAEMEKHYMVNDFAFSLVPSFHKCKGMYTDDCHVTAEGNQILAAAIAAKVSNKIQQYFDAKQR
jgi:lysophospholipase L1-like esterase